jgi:predicted anti-sigma-YlaC factor YlaD
VAPGPTSGEVVNPWWGQHLFSRAVFFLELCILVFVAGVRFYLWTRGDLGLTRDVAAREAPVDFPTHRGVEVVRVAAQWKSWR